VFDPKFFLAVVSSNEDPDMRGRVRIRIMGVHTELTTPNEQMMLGIEEKDLPLAQCMYPVTYTGTGGTCPPPSLQPGDWVLGVSLDGPAYQNLMVLGLAKAKFNAESLADGSINAEDAFASVQQPLTPSKESEIDAKAEEALKNYGNESTSSLIANYNKERGSEYETAAKLAETKWGDANSGFASASSSGISTGTAVYNILSSLYNSDDAKFLEFQDTSGLVLDTTAEHNDVVNNILEEGYYTYCWDHYNKDRDDKIVSSILPTLAFKMGVGTVDELLDTYGDPRTGAVSYAQFWNNMNNDGCTVEASYMKEIVSELNSTGKDKNTIKDSNLKRYLNHQYRKSVDIKSKQLRILGDVVFPTLRSTIIQTHQVLPYCCSEGGVLHEHVGIDLATEKIPVLAFAAGTVIAARTDNAADCNAVVIQHSAGIKTMYLHMNNVLVKNGTKVKAGQKIGTGGGAGAKGANTHNVHLHFAVKKDSKIINPESFFRNDIGFAVKTISSANAYRKGPFEKNSTTYKDLRKSRDYSSLAWGF